MRLVCPEEARSHTLSSNQGGLLKQMPPPYDFAGTSPQISLQADLFVSLFSSPPYHFNFIFIFPQQLQLVL